MGIKWYRSLIGGALGDEAFAPGDLIPVPEDKVLLWIERGLIESVEVRQKKIPRPTSLELDTITNEDIERLNG